MLNNKKLKDFLKIIKKQVKEVLAIKIPDENNAFEVSEIYEKCESISIKCSKLKDINEALKYIRRSDEKEFLITGSLYLVGKIRNRLL